MGWGPASAKSRKSGRRFCRHWQLWFLSAKDLNNHWSTPVYWDGHLYGIFGFKQFGTAPLECVEAATGKIVWSKPGFIPAAA